MGAGYRIYNFTRRERLCTVCVGGMKAREMVWHHPSAALIVWYMLRHRGDQIAIVSDYDINDGRPIFGNEIKWEDVDSFADVFDETIAHAVAARVLIDDGWRRMFDDDPDPNMRNRCLRVDDRPGPLPSEGL